MIAQSEANIAGLSACYYSSVLTNGLYEESWFYDNNAEVCSLLETLDLADDYSSDQDHTWPGLDDRIEETFSASITGYLNIGGAAEYTFVVTSRGSVKLLFDDSAVPVVSFITNRETTRNGTFLSLRVVI